MKTLCLPMSPETLVTRKPAWRWPQLETWHIVLGAGLVVWYTGAVTVFEPNVYTMAFWYVCTHLLVPMLAISAGWFAHSLRMRTDTDTIRGLLARHTATLLLALVSLPLLLSVLNRLPFGQTMEPWSGIATSSYPVPKYKAHDPDRVHIAVTSPALGRGLQFVVPDYMLHRRSHSPVKGSVVKGFMGVPIAVRIEDTWTPLEHMRGRLDVAPSDDETRASLAVELARHGEYGEALMVIDEAWRGRQDFQKLRGLILEQIPHGVGEWTFTPTASMEQDIRWGYDEPVKRTLALYGIQLWDKAWAVYDHREKLVTVRWVNAAAEPVTGAGE